MSNRPKVALVTGITGQDGSYLTELLLTKNYIIHGIKRRASYHNQQRIDAILAKNPGRVFIHYGDLVDATAMAHLIKEIQPDEVYNLAAQSHVAVSFVMPSYTSEVNASGTVNVLEAIRLAGLERKTRFYQASTSELYGGQQTEPFDEEVPFNPRSPYAAAKLMGYWVTRNYRDAYGMFACNGILFNHESPRRGETFVTRKITLAVAAIATGQQDCVVLGNLNSVRDWGHARDFVEAMWAMLQLDAPDDFVIATGDTHTVREFCDEAFGVIGVQIAWEGTAENEVGRDKATGKVVVRVSPEFYRPTEVDHLLGNPKKAIKRLGFNPRKTTFKELVYEMVTSDLAEAKAKIAAQKEYAALTARL